MIIISDLHLKENQPFQDAQKEFLKWLDEKFPNDILIFLGDCFDSSAPMWSIYSLFKSFLMNRERQVYIIQGNHSLSKRKGSALKGLHLIPNVKVFFEMEECTIENQRCLFMPHIYRDLKETYEKIEGAFDFIFTHLTPWFAPFSEVTGITFSKNLKGQFIHGHEHINCKRDNHLILGVPYITRHKEQDKKFQVLEITQNKELIFYDVPQFFTYETISYGEEPTSKNNILNIKNTPSIIDAYSKYKDYYIRDDGIELKINEDINQTLSFDSSDIKQEFMTFCKEENIDDKLRDFSLGFL
jgi:hypothetical protein